MRTVMILASGAALSAALVASPALARDHDKLGKGDYFVYVTEIRDMMDLSKPAPPAAVHAYMSTADFDRLARMDNLCRVQSKELKPSAFKNVFLVALRNAPGAVLGGAIGAKVGGFVPKGSPVTAAGYGAYNGIANVGGSIGAGINAYEMGKHGMIGGCMIGLLAQAQAAGYLRNITITYDTFPVRGHSIRRSELSASMPDRDADTVAYDAEDDTSDTPAPAAAPPVLLPPGG